MSIFYLFILWTLNISILIFFDWMTHAKNFEFFFFSPSSTQLKIQNSLRRHPVTIPSLKSHRTTIITNFLPWATSNHQQIALSHYYHCTTSSPTKTISLSLSLTHFLFYTSFSLSLSIPLCRCATTSAMGFLFVIRFRFFAGVF